MFERQCFLDRDLVVKLRRITASERRVKFVTLIVAFGGSCAVAVAVQSEIKVKHKKKSMKSWRQGSLPKSYVKKRKKTLAAAQKLCHEGHCVTFCEGEQTANT